MFPIVNKRSSFSIIVPVKTRQEVLRYCIDSILRQTYPVWELILVDDYSLDDTWSVIQEYGKKDSRIRGIKLTDHSGRCAARNIGMKAAKNDWIVWLDSDDEFLKTYLEVLESWMNDDFPGYKCYHYGAVVVRMGRQDKRDAMQLKEQGEGMEEFPSGSIGTGSFCFHKSVLETVGYLPEALDPYRFADGCKKETPAITKWYGKPPTIRNTDSKTLGNPWGDDWYMFYKITRKFKSKALPIGPYVQFVRNQPWSLRGKDDR